MALQALADIEAKYRVKMAASNGRLEDAMESVTLHDGRRRPSRRSNYEILLKVCPAAQPPFDPQTLAAVMLLTCDGEQPSRCTA